MFQEEEVEFLYNENTVVVSDNYKDKWILSFTQSLIKFVKKEMEGRLTKPAILAFQPRTIWLNFA